MKKNLRKEESEIRENGEENEKNICVKATAGKNDRYKSRKREREKF